LKKLDIYIIKKFLGTFFYSLLLIICIVIVFDVSEKLQDFIEKEAPLRAIIFDYYLNFAPYFANLFSPLFVFISVIFFTSKLAGNSEIVAILSSGVSFKRLLRPYIIAAASLAVLSFYLNNFLIPEANKKRLAFEEQYVRNKFVNRDKDIHMQIDNNTYVYMSRFIVDLNMAEKFSLEKFEDGRMVYKLLANNAKWDSTSNKWQVSNYTERHINKLDESFVKGGIKDIELDLHPDEFKRRENYVETMGYFELNEFIEEAIFKGSQNIALYEVEKQKRTSMPFATFILTIIGVSISSRKVRGGIGLHIGLGLLISFSYILFMQISATFAINSGVPAVIAVWAPNLLYGILALYLLKKAPK